MLRREAAAVDPGAGVVEAMPLTEYMGASLYPLKLAATLLAVLGAISVLMAAIGLYSVMAYAVTQRTHELGIRMAVGAQPRDVLGLVMRQGLALTGAGLAAGVLGRARCHSRRQWPAGERKRSRSAHLRRRRRVPGAGGDAGELCARAPRYEGGSHGGAALRVAAAGVCQST